MGKDNLMIIDVERKIEERVLSLKEVDDLLLETSWLEEPELIRKLLVYKELPQDTLPTAKKTDAEIKSEWKTEKLSDGTLRLVSYKGKDTIVNVPEKLGKVSVSELGNLVFSVTQPRIKKELKESRARIKEIRLGNCIKAIGTGTFEACESLEKVVLSKSITMIPDNAFSDCKKLRTVELPEGITMIGAKAFSGCEALEQIDIPEGVKCFSIIGQAEWWDNEKQQVCTFENCINLKKVKLPESMTEISAWSFDGCINLSEINIPSQLEKIGVGAFRNCKKLTTLTIPQTVTSINVSKLYSWPAFEGCKKLTLHVSSGSYAEQYAVKAGIRYVVD